MIITRQRRVPWSWVVLTHLPWAAMLFASVISSLVFTLEIRKFTANPITISLLLTLNGFVWTVVNPIIHFLSDRIWTRFGRRKVFYVPAMCVQIVAILCIPLAPTLPWLLVGFVIYQVAIVFSQPKESLAQEVVPNSQRGRASVLHSIFVQVGLFSYSIALIGRFDDIMYRQPFERFIAALSGEALTFWVTSTALLMVVLIVGLGIKEMKPRRRLDLREDLGGRITPWRFFKRLFVSCFSAEFWPIYLLAFSKAMYALNLGPMVVLMYTEQWAYSTQDMGTNHAITFLVTMVVLSFGAAFIDKCDRLKTYAALIAAGMVLKIFWYCFVLFVAPEQRPALWQILVFGESIGLVGHIVSMVMYPLQYEYVPSNKLGTANAGLAIFFGLLGLVTGPLIGVWIYNYSKFFHPGPGSEVVTVLQAPVGEDQATAWAAGWEAGTGEPFHVSIYRPFEFPGDAGRQWRIRRVDEEADAIRKRNEELVDELKQIKGAITAETVAGNEEEVQRFRAQEAERMAELEAGRERLEAKVADLKAFIQRELGAELPDPVDAIREVDVAGEHMSVVLVVTYPIPEKRIERVEREILIALEDFGWDRVELANEGAPEAPLLRVDAFRAERPGLPELDERFVAWVGEAAARRPGFDPSEEAVREVAALVDATEAVTAAYRSYLVRPFPDGAFKAQRVDYFSSYLLMILTDFLALGSIAFLRSRERQGKIRRWGALEQQAADEREAAAS